MTEAYVRLSRVDQLKPEDDWRSLCSSLVQRFWVARKRNLLTDVEFLVGEGSSAVSFSAHKLVLAFGSPVFEAMFYGQMAESKSPISIVDIDPETFDILLRYIYGEVITFSSVVSAVKIYFAADKYLIDQLKTVVENHMPLTAINESQFWEIILQDKFLRIPVIKSKYLDYISKHASTVLKCELLLDVSLDVMQAILQLNSLNATEYELLSAVGRWGHGRDATKSKLKSLLLCIRFSNLTSYEFSSFDESHPGILRSDDSLAILKHLCSPSEFKLPEWCSLSKQRRNDAFASQSTRPRKRNNSHNRYDIRKRTAIGRVTLH